MFIFGHMGFGSALARPWQPRLPPKWLLLGTLLPDLIDKPLFYGLKHFGSIDFISCTRTLGHTGLFLLALVLVALLRRSPAYAAVAVGVATHILLDNLGDRLNMSATSFAWMALWFPYYHGHFGVQGPRTALQHLESLNDLYTWITESIGLCLLLWIYGPRRRAWPGGIS